MFTDDILIKSTSRVESEMRICMQIWDVGISASAPGRTQSCSGSRLVSTRSLICTLWLPSKVSETLAGCILPGLLQSVQGFGFNSDTGQEVQGSFQVDHLPNERQDQGDAWGDKQPPVKSFFAFRSQFSFDIQDGGITGFQHQSLALNWKDVRKGITHQCLACWTFCLAGCHTVGSWRERGRRTCCDVPSWLIPNCWLCILIVSPSGKTLPPPSWSESPARGPFSETPWLHSRDSGLYAHHPPCPAI